MEHGRSLAFEHSLECPVSREFAWRFWTTVDNWKLDADVESVELTGPFAAGSQGVTLTRSSGRIEWLLAEVEPEAGAVIEIVLPDALVRFRWTFEDAGGGTRITQRASLEGENAPSFLAAVAGLESGIPDGMRKLCDTMAEAAGGTG